MAMTLVIQLRPKEMEDFLSWAKAMLPETLEFEGCESVTFHRDAEDAGRLVLLERWSSAEHREKYVATRSQQGEMSEMLSLLAEPVTVQVLSDLEM